MIYRYWNWRRCWFCTRKHRPLFNLCLLRSNLWSGKMFEIRKAEALAKAFVFQKFLTSEVTLQHEWEQVHYFYSTKATKYSWPFPLEKNEVCWSETSFWNNCSLLHPRVLRMQTIGFLFLERNKFYPFYLRCNCFYCVLFIISYISLSPWGETGLSLTCFKFYQRNFIKVGGHLGTATLHIKYFWRANMEYTKSKPE